MARVKGGTVARARRKKVLKEAKGYFGSKHRLYKTAHEQLMHSGQYAFRDRRQNKRNFRKLWISRINAACREEGISYSKFISGLNKAGVVVNRKMLAELAIDNREAFSNLVSISKDALDGKKYEPSVANLKVDDDKVEVKKKDSTTTRKSSSVKKDSDAKSSTSAKKTTSTKKTTVKE